jgi:hypothetical protein
LIRAANAEANGRFSMGLLIPYILLRAHISLNSQYCILGGKSNCVAKANACRRALLYPDTTLLITDVNLLCTDIKPIPVIKVPAE